MSKEQVRWWCAHCPTSVPSETELNQHYVDRHPHTGLSTSAQLRQTQEALAASQADLTRVETEMAAWQGILERVQVERDDARRQLTTARRRVNEAAEVEYLALDQAARSKRERDVARAELASARTELEQLRGPEHWIVARDGGRNCVSCEREIRRGEAYDLAPGEGLGALNHIRCPDERSTT